MFQLKQFKFKNLIYSNVNTTYTIMGVCVAMVTGGTLDVIGRPPADIPHDQSPFQGRHGQRRDSFPYGHYQAIRDENILGKYNKIYT